MSLTDEQLKRWEEEARQCLVFKKGSHEERLFAEDAGGTPLFIFRDYEDSEIISSRFCSFLDDPQEPHPLKREDFLDLGVL